MTDIYDIQGRVTLIPYDAPPEPEPPAPLPEPITGLVARQANTSNCPMDRTADLGGVVAELRWDESQPNQGDVLRDPEDPANTEWAQLQYARKTGLPIRMRCFEGRYAPNWAKWIVGPYPPGDQRNGVETDSDSGGLSTHGRFWLTPYQQASLEWAEAVLDLFEDDDQIVSFAWHPATLTYAEPFQRATGGNSTRAKTNRQRLVDAGLAGCVPGSDAVDLSDAYAIQWPLDMWLALTGRKRLFLPFNPLQGHASADGVESGPVTNPDNFTQKMIDHMAETLGELSEHANNSIRPPLPESYVSSVYEPFRIWGASGKLSAAQTASMSQISDAWRTAVDDAGNAPNDLSDGAGMLATLDLCFGFTTPDDDPYNTLSGLTGPMTFRSAELPSGWVKAKLGDGSVALSAAVCKKYNDQAANQPNGTAIIST
jgi:hypothetical protein